MPCFVFFLEIDINVVHPFRLKWPTVESEQLIQIRGDFYLLMTLAQKFGFCSNQTPV